VSGRRSGFALPLVLLLLVASWGCETVKPVYEMPEGTPTLVLVDDPQHRLGGPSHAAVIATRIRHDLRRRADLEQVIPGRQLMALKQELGDDYPTTPIDRVGRAVGASHVIHVSVLSAVTEARVGLLHPQARVAVKVIDAEAGRRVYPESPRGFQMQVELPMKVVSESEATSLTPRYREALCQKIGREVARLFYAYDMRDPKERDPSLGELAPTRPHGR